MDDYGLDEWSMGYDGGAYSGGDFFGDSGGGYSDWDTSWFPQGDLLAQFNTPTPDILASRGMYDASFAGVNANPSAAFNPAYYGMAAGTPDYVLNRAGLPVGIDPATGQPTGALYGQGGTGAPGGTNGGGGNGGGGWGSLINPAGLLGMGGGLASIIGALASGGVTGGAQYKPTTAQKANMNQGYSMLQPLATGTSPLQLQQQSLLSAIMSGQGLAQPYAQAVERAYEPQFGSLYQQAVDAGRSRGFYDSPATAPPGGAILGPGLAELQGQIAKDKLNLMTQLPGLYNQPIQSQGNFANAFLTGSQNAPFNKETTQPIGSQIGTALGSGVQGVGTGLAQQQTAAQNQQFQNSLLAALANRGGNTDMSGTGGYNWSSYGGL